uniref:Uncharacterized protein n=1 Tax=Caenorhabditis japonica TaxID=281687 RepID=A0A8R1DVF2_CAEJA
MAEETSLDDMVAPPAAEDVVDKIEDSAITPDDVEMADDRDGSTDSDEPAALSSGLRSRTAAGSDGSPVAEDNDSPIEINPELLKENKITDNEKPLLADADMLDNSFEDMPPVDEETEKELLGPAEQLQIEDQEDPHPAPSPRCPNKLPTDEEVHPMADLYGGYPIEEIPKELARRLAWTLSLEDIQAARNMTIPAITEPPLVMERPKREEREFNIS